MVRLFQRIKPWFADPHGVIYPIRKIEENEFAIGSGLRLAANPAPTAEKLNRGVCDGRSRIMLLFAQYASAQVSVVR